MANRRVERPSWEPRPSLSPSLFIASSVPDTLCVLSCLVQACSGGRAAANTWPAVHCFILLELGHGPEALSRT